MPFASIRSKLIAAFVAVIALSLLLASGAFAYLLADYQAERERDRLQEIAMLYRGQVSAALRAGLSVQEIGTQLEQGVGDSGVRVLLVDSRGTVVYDTEDNKFTGTTFPMPLPGGRRPGVAQGTLSTPSGDEVWTVVPLFPLVNSGMRLAVVAPEQSLTNAWRAALPRLSMAAVGALLVSILIAWWLAANITRPLLHITRASEEIARGNYDPQLAQDDTRDEVGRLSRAFTIMARQVARSHRAMRDLLQNVSHDLRTPLTSISGFAGALVDGTLSGPEGAREAGRVIGEEAERMRRLVEDLLYLGRIESGELSLEREPVDLADLAHAVLARFSFRAQETSINLTVHAPRPVNITGDPHRLSQMLDNLVENAFKHTPPSGSIEVTATREMGRLNGGARTTRISPMAVLTVHNSGSYIRPEEAERVFERFYQIDRARAGSSNGRGLGLAIAREIVQAHAGRIDLESSPRSGTTFIVRLPSLEAPLQTALISSEPTRPAEIGAAHR
ncbi:MAG TPA: HAMP domain-containing sensor histidine kinase [Chloroflexota bacterium]|nr:HAMP domain-containing sensor histidine kinase [Chloroflexota bacterium]